MKWPDDNEEAANWVYNVERNWPENWDETARAELSAIIELPKAA